MAEDEEKEENEDDEEREEKDDNEVNKYDFTNLPLLMPIISYA